MKKYAGSSMTLFAAIILPLFAILPIFAGILIFQSEISVATIFLFVMCLCCTILFTVYLIKVSNQLYTWATFNKSAINIKSWFRKEYTMEYCKCIDVGIGCYGHGFSSSGIPFYFIYFSYNKLSEESKLSINTQLPSKTFFKISYSKKLYDYLVNTLPSKQSLLLKQSYLIAFSKK